MSNQEEKPRSHRSLIVAGIIELLYGLFIYCTQALRFAGIASGAEAFYENLSAGYPIFLIILGIASILLGLRLLRGREDAYRHSFVLALQIILPISLVDFLLFGNMFGIWNIINMAYALILIFFLRFGGGWSTLQLHMKKTDYMAIALMIILLAAYCFMLGKTGFDYLLTKPQEIKLQDPDYTGKTSYSYRIASYKIRTDKKYVITEFSIDAGGKTFLAFSDESGGILILNGHMLFDEIQVLWRRLGFNNAHEFANTFLKERVGIIWAILKKTAGLSPRKTFSIDSAIWNGYMIDKSDQKKQIRQYLLWSKQGGNALEMTDAAKTSGRSDHSGLPLSVQILPEMMDAKKEYEMGQDYLESDDIENAKIHLINAVFTDRFNETYRHGLERILNSKTDKASAAPRFSIK